MIALIVPQGTPVKVIKVGKEWMSPNFQKRETTKENMFFAEDIRVDPLGNIGSVPQDLATIGGWYARHGYYGFERDGWVMLVHMRYVEAH